MVWAVLTLVSVLAALWIVRLVRTSNAKSQEAAVASRKRETSQKDLVSKALGSRPQRREGEN